MTTNGGSRHDRTLIYTRGKLPRSPAGLVIGQEAACSVAVQAATLSAVNILARCFPTLVLSVPDAPLRLSSGGSTLVDACVALAARVDPTVDVELRRPEPRYAVGIAARAAEASIHVGGAGWTARMDRAPAATELDPASMFGLCMGVTFGTGALFREAIGEPAVARRSFSLWDLATATDRTGPIDLSPLDVGSVWLVGAGAVGSALAWWLHLVGVLGCWTVIDADVADVTNLDRSLGLFDADFRSQRNKARAVASLLPGADPKEMWWSDWISTDPTSPDVVIPVANEFGVRRAVAAFSHPATIHATTSRDWTAELHRHLIGRDGCISCRIPEDAPRFACATAPAPPVGTGSEASGRDAALPFLSGAAGLLLAAGLFQLQAGAWAAHAANQWAVYFDASEPVVRSRQWEEMRPCGVSAVQRARARQHGTTRWRSLDPFGADS